MRQFLILFVLFPFLHGTSYQAELVSCQQDSIRLKTQGQEITVSLFNVKINETSGWNKTCSLLEDASSIRFEIDPGSAVEEPVPVYLFADEDLIQEVLVKNKLGFIQIRNPEYTYEKRLEQAEGTTQVVAEVKETKEQRTYALQAPLFLLGLIVSWCILLYIFIRKKRR